MDEKDLSTSLYESKDLFAVVKMDSYFLCPEVLLFWLVLSTFS